MRGGRRTTACAAAIGSIPAATAQAQPARPDLQGIWVGSTMTPLQRPADVRDRERFTPEEAAEFERTIEDRMRRALATDADASCRSISTTSTSSARRSGSKGCAPR
jgi:hypothetical protein